MSDLETRLRNDAARTEPAPDFHAALTAALDRGSRLPAWPAVAAAVLVIGTAATIAVRFATADHHSRATQPGGSSVTASGAPVSSDGTILGAVVTPASHAPRSLMLVVGAADRAGCFDYQAAVLDQTPTEVRVDVVTSEEPDANAVCSKDLVPYEAQQIVLDAPLDGRPVIDDATGRPIEVFDTTVPTPDYVPSGYTESEPFNTDPMRSVTFDGQPGALAPLTLARFYQSASDYWLTVVAAPSGAVNPGAQVVDHTVVDGIAATVTESAQTRCVTWIPSVDRGLQVCSDVGPAAGTAPATALLSETELLRVASSLGTA